MTASAGHRRYACGLLLLSLLVVDASKYAKICELKSSPLVSLEYDPITGQVSITDESPSNANETTTEQQRRLLMHAPGGNADRIVQLGRLVTDGRKKFLRGSRLLNNNSTSNVFVAENTDSMQDKIIYSARSCPCDETGYTFCLVEGILGQVPDSCGISWSDNIPKHNITDSDGYNTLEIGCFGLDSQLVFSRNVWPVIVLWYGALILFLLATSNGMYTRAYIVHLLCPSLRTNERQVERIMVQWNDSRNRMHALSLRAARLTERPERYLFRTPRVRVPSGLSSRSSDEEQRHETERWWIQQAELMGIITRVTQSPQVEYVLKTRSFNAERGQGEVGCVK